MQPRFCITLFKLKTAAHDAISNDRRIVARDCFHAVRASRDRPYDGRLIDLVAGGRFCLTDLIRAYRQRDRARGVVEETIAAYFATIPLA